MIIQRRTFLGGLASMLAAPAIVRASALMPINSALTEKIVIGSIGESTLYQWSYNRIYDWTTMIDAEYEDAMRDGFVTSLPCETSRLVLVSR